MTISDDEESPTPVTSPVPAPFQAPAPSCMFTQLLAESQEPDLIDEALKQSANFEKERLYQLLTTAGTRLKRDLAEHAKEKDYAIALKEAKERSENHVTFIKVRRKQKLSR